MFTSNALSTLVQLPHVFSVLMYTTSELNQTSSIALSRNYARKKVITKLPVWLFMQRKLAIPDNSLFLCDLRNWIDFWELKREQEAKSKFFQHAQVQFQLIKAALSSSQHFFIFVLAVKKKKKERTSKSYLTNSWKGKKGSFVIRGLSWLKI